MSAPALVEFEEARPATNTFARPSASDVPRQRTGVSAGIVTFGSMTALSVICASRKGSPVSWSFTMKVTSLPPYSSSVMVNGPASLGSFLC